MMTMPTVGARGRVLADVLVALFEHDREHLQAASENIAGEVADTIHRAFAEYQSVAERRRQLGADVGEAVARLIDAMQEAGFREEQAQHADVWALREGVYQRSSTSARTLRPSSRERSQW
jgi:hypothetical protein